MTPPQSKTARTSPQGAKKSGPRGTIVIDAERCKGCELCIPACPPGVLRMSPRRNDSGYLLPELLEGCTGCSACLMVCPDFCFDVYQFDDSDSHSNGEKSHSNGEKSTSKQGQFEGASR